MEVPEFKAICRSPQINVLKDSKHDGSMNPRYPSDAVGRGNSLAKWCPLPIFPGKTLLWHENGTMSCAESARDSTASNKYIQISFLATSSQARPWHGLQSRLSICSKTFRFNPAKCAGKWANCRIRGIQRSQKNQLFLGFRWFQALLKHIQLWRQNVPWFPDPKWLS